MFGNNGILNQATNAATRTEIEDAREKIGIEVVGSFDSSGVLNMDLLKENLSDNLGINTNGMVNSLPTNTFYYNDLNFYIDDKAQVIYGENFVVQTDGSWNASKGVNSPELFEGMTAVYWDEEGTEHELTSSSTAEEWDQWYDYNGNGDGQNKWANAVTKDSSGNITGYWVWIPRYAYKIESGLFTSTSGTISVKFLQGTSDLDENEEEISRNYAYSGDAMTDYVVHPAFRDGTDNNFMLGEWDEEVSGFWVAKYEAGYQANTITDNDGTLSTTISNADDEVVYSDLKYTSYRNILLTNALGQDLSETGYLNESLSFPVFLPLTYSYNNICIGDSYVLSQSIDTANNFYGLNSSATDSHMMKNSEWGAVVYLAQSIYGRNGTEITINDYYTSESTPYRTAIAGLASSDGSESSTTSLSNVSTYNTTNGYKGNTTGNVTGIYDLSGGLWDRVSGYILNGHANLTGNGTNSTYGSSGTLMGATSTANANGYQTLSTRTYTVYPYDSSNDSGTNNYNVYKGLLSSTYGYADAILELSSGESTMSSWNSDYSQFVGTEVPFFLRGGNYHASSGAGSFAFIVTVGDAFYDVGFRVVLVAE